MTLKIYVEGGGQRRSLRTECRRGFSEFIRKAGFAGRMPAIVACGSRNEAYESFMTALGQGKPALLLVDSEEPLRSESPPTHLELRDGWSFADVDEDQVHLMVECMESWFLADKQTLETFYGQGFRASALPGNPQVETIAKADVYKSLERATQATKTKGRYGKGSHSFKILGLLDPQKVRAAAPHANLLLAHLDHAVNDA